MVNNQIKIYNFVQTPRKFIIAELLIRKLGSFVIISTDEDRSLRIESSAIINLRGVSTKLYILNRILLKYLHLDILLTLLVIHNHSLARYQLFNSFPLNKTSTKLDYYYYELRMSIDVRVPYVTPELNNELHCNVGNMWEKFTLYLYALKPRDVSTSKVY